MKVKELIGKIIISIDGIGELPIEELIFNCSDKSRYRMYHAQYCCENVYLADVIGDLSDLIGAPILKAEEVVSEDETPANIAVPEFASLDESFTWTFYKFATKKGYVDLRWIGESNGYYSESVDFEKIG